MPVVDLDDAVARDSGAENGRALHSSPAIDLTGYRQISATCTLRSVKAPFVSARPGPGASAD